MLLHILLVLLVIAIVVLVLGLVNIRYRLICLQHDVNEIYARLIPPGIGGRQAPSFAELQAAKNRMDVTGVAQPGGPN